MTTRTDDTVYDQSAPKDAISYAMRVECQSDAFLIRAALAQWVYTWTEEWDVCNGMREPPDMKVVFQLAWRPPTYSELQWLISALEDCHVAAESLRIKAAYTGERTRYAALFRSMTRPGAETIGQAKAGLERTLKWLPALRHGLVGQKHRLAAELGDTRAHMVREQERMTRFSGDFAAMEGRPADANEIAIAGRELALQTWNNRPHR